MYLILGLCFLIYSCNDLGNYESWNKAQIQLDIVKEEHFHELEEITQKFITNGQFQSAERIISDMKSSDLFIPFEHEIENLRTSKNERQLYVKIIQENNLVEIERYLEMSDYKNYRVEVEDLKMKIESDLFLQACAKNSIQTLNEFITNYPESHFIVEAKTRLEDLEQKIIKDSLQAALEIDNLLEEIRKNEKIYNKSSRYEVPYGFSNNYSNSYYNHNDYVNPNSAPPVVKVKGYYKSNGTYVEPHVRTAPNKIVTDNLRYNP